MSRSFPGAKTPQIRKMTTSEQDPKRTSALGDREYKQPGSRTYSGGVGVCGAGRRIF